MEKSFEFAENVIGFMVHEEIDREKMKDILSEIEERIKVVTPVCIYIEDETDEGISMGGFLKAVEFHFSHSNDLDKLAVVSNSKMLKNAMELKDLVVPANVKSFEKGERMQAMNWLME
ncbi:SpoIIAA family protein [Salinimicrobium xinjiangense]|uniref:STAS/SEC14 domain-containing protein n=1 Tax=Salinimicrobium xinjiangense TaxID=438596 RepID=UPI0003F9D71C|nr:STAS/SEC14 domain-containing protein [Salinimicrobium xinjiangense]